MEYVAEMHLINVQHFEYFLLLEQHVIGMVFKVPPKNILELSKMARRFSDPSEKLEFNWLDNTKNLLV